VKLQILDASVAIKWFVPEEEGRREALAILDEVRDAPAGFAVPDLFFNEMLAVLTRLASPDSSLVREYLDALQDLGIERFGNGRELLDCAADLACALGLTGYDAVYLAAAKLAEGCWITADARAHHKVRDRRLAKLVCQR
jgi:predicted nucleic acid-binding protein